MTNPIGEPLAARIARLERENRFIKRLCAIAVLGLTAVFIVGADSSERAKVLEVQKLVIRDELGATRAILRATKEGVAFTCMAEDGSRASLFVGGPEGTALVLRSQGDGAIQMNVPPNRNPGIGLSRSGTRALYLSPAGGDGMDRIVPPPKPPDR